MIKVLIVGRPNVGKSTLFNALVNRNLAIVDSAPGTTRDLVYAFHTYKNVCFNFIDSAGIGFKGMEIYKKANKQTLDILNSIDFILFVLDAKSQLVDEDFYINNLLSKNVFEKTALVINKVDNDKVLSDIYELSKFKYNYTFLTSAVHKKGIQEIKDFLYIKFRGVDTVPRKKDEYIRVAIIGKRGVGKSSYINAILGKEIRLVSSKSPTTRDIGVFEYSIFNTNFTLYDTAGLFKIKGNIDSPEFHAIRKVYKLVEKIDVVFLLLDITNYDTQFDKYLCKLLLDGKKLVVLCFNKIDLLDKDKLQYEKKVIEKEFSYVSYVPKVFMSVKESMNIFKPFEFSIDLYNQAKSRIKTSVLNRIMTNIASEKVFKRSRKLGKIYYATQISVLPVGIAIFVNDRNLFKPSDLRFIENKIRKESGLSGIPIFLKLINRKELNIA